MSDCIFCSIVAGDTPASIVCADELALAFVDLRQYNAGHTLVIPRRHVADVRDLDAESGAALMAMVSRVTRAVSVAFPNNGITLWHSIGPAAFQEVPHMHVHVHPRLDGDRLFALYPTAPALQARDTLDAHAARIRAAL